MTFPFLAGVPPIPLPLPAIATPPPWVTLLLLASAIVGAVGVIAKGIRYIVHFIGRVDTALPVILDIAAEFRPNGGGSLKDKMDRLEAAATDAREVAEEARQSAGAAAAKTDQLAAAISSLATSHERAVAAATERIKGEMKRLFRDMDTKAGATEMILREIQHWIETNEMGLPDGSGKSG